MGGVAFELSPVVLVDGFADASLAPGVVEAREEEEESASEEVGLPWQCVEVRSRNAIAKRERRSGELVRIEASLAEAWVATCAGRGRFPLKPLLDGVAEGREGHSRAVKSLTVLQKWST